jgi:predicted GH43/DUF377 family glycosyl hydrolase
MPHYELGEPEPLVLDADPSLSAMFALAPYVWTEGDRWLLALRTVPMAARPEDKVSRVHLGTGDDGLRFTMDPDPFLAPGPGADDRDGCEDPTVVLADGYAVFYSGWNQERGEGQLLWAGGDDLGALTKRGRVLPRPEEYTNAKEATVLPAADGSWRLYFEYAAGGHSLIGAAEAPALEGPWTPCPSPLGLRDGHWDGWHLSPGPVVGAGTDTPVLFYNGANQRTQWRIGWAQLDPDCREVVARSDDPLVRPPPVSGDDTDIAFSASAVEHRGTIFLYYSVSDRLLLRVPLT